MCIKMRNHSNCRPDSKHGINHELFFAWVRIESTLHNFDVFRKQSFCTLKSRFHTHKKAKQKKAVEFNSQQYI